MELPKSDPRSPQGRDLAGTKRTNESIGIIIRLHPLPSALERPRSTRSLKTKVSGNALRGTDSLQHYSHRRRHLAIGCRLSTCGRNVDGNIYVLGLSWYQTDD